MVSHMGWGHEIRLSFWADGGCHAEIRRKSNCDMGSQKMSWSDVAMLTSKS